jgi:hypothetical protein
LLHFIRFQVWFGLGSGVRSTGLQRSLLCRVTRFQAVFTLHCIDEMAQFAIVFVPSIDSGSSTAAFSNLFFECHVGQECTITEIIEELNQT